MEIKPHVQYLLKCALSIVTLLLIGTQSARAQNETIVFSERDMQMAQAIKQIEKQTNYLFAYDKVLLDHNSTVCFPLLSLNITEALSIMAENKPVEFVFKGRYIIMIPRIPQKRINHRPDSVARTGDIYRKTDIASLEAVYPRYTDVPQPMIFYDTIYVPVEKSYPEPYSEYEQASSHVDSERELPTLAVKTNLLYAAATLTPNIGFEMAAGQRSTVELSGSWNQWNYHGTVEDNDKLNHYVIRAEYRYWLYRRFTGHYLGANLFFGQFNISGKTVPTLFEKRYRYEGLDWGASLTYGYQMVLGRRWNAEFNVGAGVARIGYRLYDCALCSDKIGESSVTYFGPTRVGVSLVYLIN